MQRCKNSLRGCHKRVASKMISQTVSSEVDNNETEQEELNWLFVGDFLFYLRLLARQFATLSKEAGGMHKNMLIVPDPETAWEQLAETNCQAMILDCVEASEPQLEFIRGVRQNYPTVRLILVSAVLDRNTEGALMEAGAHLCFSKPRSVEEAAAMYRLVDALTGSRGFIPMARSVAWHRPASSSSSAPAAKVAALPWKQFEAKRRLSWNKAGSWMRASGTSKATRPPHSFFPLTGRNGAGSNTCSRRSTTRSSSTPISCGVIPASRPSSLLQPPRRNRWCGNRKA